MDCRACGRAVPLAAGERIGFRDACPGCGADLHACRNCAHHDPAAYNACREPNAERVLDPEQANRCDYFAPAQASTGGAGASEAREEALSELERLFKR